MAIATPMPAFAPVARLLVLFMSEADGALGVELASTRVLGFEPLDAELFIAVAGPLVVSFGNVEVSVTMSGVLATVSGVLTTVSTDVTTTIELVGTEGVSPVVVTENVSAGVVAILNYDACDTTNWPTDRRHSCKC